MPKPYPSNSLGSQSSKIIRQELHDLSEKALRDNPLLAHQDVIGFSILLGSIAAIAGCAWAYAQSLLPAWSVVVLVAFFMSLLHELEHDLIHRLYFRTSPWLYNTALFAVWVLRPNTISPWVRRDWHLHHHRASGFESDIEERMLTNGEPWGIRRAFMSLDNMLSLILRPVTARRMQFSYAAAIDPAPAAQARIVKRNRLAILPFSLFYFSAWYFYAGIHSVQLACAALHIQWQPSPFTLAIMPGLDFAAVTILIPNALRAFCLHYVSSNIHYYGDIEPRNIVQQTQVWNAAWLLPLQLFCFNFGSTHAIHHFAVQYPFYVRQLIARDAHKVMRRHGVRFNDFSSMRRANRWHSSPQQASSSVLNAPQLAQSRH